MNRTKAIKEFRESYVKNICNETLTNLDCYYLNNKEQFKNDFELSFKNACQNICAAQNDGCLGEINYLVLCMLRTKIAKNDFSFIYKACNYAWLLDIGQFNAGIYYADFPFSYYLEMQNKLLKEYRRYIGKIVPQDISVIMQEHSSKFMQYVSNIAKYNILELVSWDEFQKIKRAPKFEIHVGEYLDYFEPIYFEDNNKNYEEITKKFSEKTKIDFSFKDLKGIDFRNRNFIQSNLRFCDLRNSNFSGCNYSYSVLIGSTMENSNLSGVNFSYCLLNEVNFKNCNLENSLFTKSIAYCGLEYPNFWDTVGYLPINFEGSNLRNTDFVGADLKGAVFDNANLEGSVFSKDQIEYLSLNKKQLNNIKVV